MSATLTRLCFFMPAAQVADFETVYERELAPFLHQLGWVAGPEVTKNRIAGIFTRLFVEDGPQAIEQKRRVLRTNTVWRAHIKRLGECFGLQQVDGGGYRLEALRTPTGPGQQIPMGSGQHYQLWTTYGAEDGLIVPLVQNMLEDRNGGFWLGMTRGVCHFDKGQLTTYTQEDGIVSDYVLSMVQDSKGTLWFGTDCGIALYDGRYFEAMTTADGLVGNHVRCLVEDGPERMWIGTARGLSYYDGSGFTNFTAADGLAHENVLALCRDSAGDLWVGTEGGLSCYDGSGFVSFTSADGLCHSRVWALCPASNGHLWIGTERGANCYNGQQITQKTTADGLTHNNIRAILEDRQGNIWFGSGVEGCSRYDGRGFENFTMKDGLAHNHIRAILEDRQGRVWFSTGGGVSCYNSRYISIYTVSEGLPSDGVVALCRDGGGRIWAGTWDGVACRQERGFEALGCMRGKNVWSICEDKCGSLWFGLYEGGICRYDGEVLSSFSIRDGLADHTVSAMQVDPDGGVWFGTGKGLSYYDGEGFITRGLEDGLGQTNVYALLQDRQGHLWVGTKEGISRYNGRQFVPFGLEEGLACEVFCIYQDRRAILWFGTNRGLSAYDGKDITSYGPAEGLNQGFIMAIAEDSRGHLWLGTFGGGVYRFDGTIFQHLSTRDGLPHNAIQHILADGQDIWLASEGGVVRYRSADQLPLVRLKGVAADQWYDAEAQSINVPVSQKLIVVEFEGVSPTTLADNLVYNYRLVGRDEQWQTTGQKRVELHQLAKGAYAFEVRCVDRDLNFSKIAHLEIKVVADPVVESLTQVLSGSEHNHNFIGTSPSLRRAQALLSEVAQTEVTVLIMGETGTGKGLAARALHGKSMRNKGPFIQVNCGALPDNLIESELFGHERGAFTGALSQKLGKVEIASGGTLFLDEIGDLPTAAQVKLLHFLQDHTFERVGGTQVLTTDVRVVAATNRDLPEMVQEGAFREDLYFRLQVFPIVLPPLRQRREDVYLLATYFMEQMAAHLNKPVQGFHPDVLSVLEDYKWPGNVRELEHVVQRAVIVCRGAEIGMENITLADDLGAQEGTSSQGREGDTADFLSLEEHERRYIYQVLEAADWVIRGPRGAAKILGLHDSTLRGRMRKLGIVRPEKE